MVLGGNVYKRVVSGEGTDQAWGSDIYIFSG